MTLNISGTQSNPEGADAPSAATPGRRVLVDEVVDELTAWNPREFIAAFRRWHQGAVSLVHLNILTLLEVEGPMSMSRLADALDISVAAVTGLIDRMEQRNLVERQHDTADRRVVVVHPADGARTLFGDIEERRRQGLGYLLGQLSEEELSGLLLGHKALRAARAAMGKRFAVERCGPARAREDRS